jgi:hypothetical protein
MVQFIILRMHLSHRTKNLIAVQFDNLHYASCTQTTWKFVEYSGGRSVRQWTIW